MRIACFPNTYGRFGPDAAIDRLASAGIHWLELPVKNHGVPSFFKETPVATDAITGDELLALKERITNAGLTVCTCNISSGNPLDDAVTERTLTKLAIAKEFGVDRVVAGGGEIAAESDWPKLVENMRRIGDQAQAYGMIYCCETHPGTCENTASMLEFIERVDHPAVRINFDTGNIFYYNEGPIDLIAEMKKVSDFIEHIHLKDTNGQYKAWYFPELGAGGAVDFQAVRTYLDEISYTGTCSLELEGIEGEPELTLDQTHQRVLDSIHHLQQTGWSIE